MTPMSANPSAASGGLRLEEWDESPATSKPVAFVPSSQRELTGHDIAQLKPRQIVNTQLGLELYVPAAWREEKNSRSLILVDPATGSRLEATGFARADVPIEKWVAMRLPIFEKEKPHMSKTGSPIVLKGESWGSRIQGIAMEYQGAEPGESETSHMLVLCLRTDSMLIAITIQARASVFAQQRAIYNWMISRSDIINTDALMTDAMRSSGAGKDGGQMSRVARPSVASNTVIETDQDKAVGNIASGQRLMRLAIICNIGLGLWTRLVGLTDRTQLVLALFLAVLVGCMSIYGMIRMAKGFGWSTVTKIIVLVLAFIPIINLITLLILNHHARARLKDEGYTVGYLGAPEAIPDSNHDLRNVIIFAAFASIIGYVAITKASRPPKELPIAEFTSPDRRFSISMPGAPKADSGQYADINDGHSYSLQSGKLLYGVSHYDLPERPANISEALDELRNDMSEGYDSTSIDERPLQLDGYAGRSLRLLDHDLLHMVNFYLVGKTVYVVEITGPKSEEYSPKVAAYFASFHLIPRE
ncbi:hypothetical protein [Undibacterium sp. TS12]|uniref:hypothetical protein n=1 Tax=Undibacterium sp. TS12 TaxID=2908202 RepID=UPI001F4CC831|nr:hypothetical protein [Undibacterium sp. TS12]MCH8620549.1 hypothetical protein [Undibacterium sp. TS12]